MTVLRFIHSPFVIADSWRPTAFAMQGFGWEVAVPSLLGTVEGREPYMPALAEAIWKDVAPDERTVLIAHSGAGALIPAVMALRPVEAVILVDALVPEPGLSWRLGAPAELTERLDSFTDCGLLPEWKRWFSARLLREMIEDEDECETFIEALPRVPASYLDEVVPEAPGWPAARGAYLHLSPAYDEEAGKAERLGFLLRRMDLHHLAPMTEPDEVAEALEILIEQLRIEP